MPGYGEIAAYGSLDYKQELDAGFQAYNKINASTGVCFGYAVKPDQGQGYNFLKNSSVPTAWIWPEPQSDPLAVMDTKNQTRYIILDEVTGRFHEVGTRNGPRNSGLVASFVDKDGEYEGAEIPCALRFREETGQAEHHFKEHVETHMYLRPESKTNKGASGYTATGYRSAFEAEMRIYTSGSLAERARTKDVPLNGDFVYDRFIRDRRLQTGFYTTASEFRLAGMDSYLLNIDESATRKAMSEHGWQDEFSRPWLWLTRGPNPALNRASGTTLDGTYFSTTDGPDGKGDSAMLFAPTGGLTFGSHDFDGDYGIVISVKNPVLPCTVVGPVSIIEDHGTYYARISGNGNTVSCPLSWTGSGWVTVLVTRRDGNICFGENGVSRGAYADTIGDFTDNVIVMDGEEGEVFNVWCVDNAISDSAFEYYYKDLTENSGDALLPLW